MSFLAQRVHVSEILRHFSLLNPTHSRFVYDSTETILAILYRKVPHMLHAKYQLNAPGGYGEEEFLPDGFYHIWARLPFWKYDLEKIYNFSPLCLEAAYEI